MVKQRLRELLPQRGNLRLGQVGPQQPHTAVDVEPDAPGRDDRLWVRRVERGDVADRETVARVQVRHRQRGADDAWERRDVRDLLDRGQEAAAALVPVLARRAGD